MITETNGYHFATFSDDRKHRYQLHRLIRGGAGGRRISVVFVMLNPSTADAFVNDPTITRCTNFALSWTANAPANAEISLKVVNLFALRTPYPKELRAAAPKDRGADIENDRMILSTTADAHIVIAAWGTNGTLADRAETVRTMLGGAGVRLHHLGLTEDGHPKHPLARGKASILTTQQPIWWSR